MDTAFGHSNVRVPLPINHSHTMTTADKISSIFAVATNNFALIVVQPTNNDINTIENALLPRLHDIDYDIYGPHKLVGLIKSTITYTVT